MKEIITTAGVIAVIATGTLFLLLSPIPKATHHVIASIAFEEIKPTQEKAIPMQIASEELKIYAEEPHLVKYVPEDVKGLIHLYAEKYDVNPAIMAWTVSCETGGTFDTYIQSGYRYKEDRPDWGVKEGDRERSFGLAQIHIADPGQRHITHAQATDPHFSLDFMAAAFSRGEYWRWSCLKK